jgi:serine/threonine-protein kinase
MTREKLVKISLYLLILLNLFFLSAAISFQFVIKGERVTLPDLIGKNYEEAKTILEAKRLSLVISGVQLSDQYDKDFIIYQDPAQESKLRLNSIIRVILSAGKEKVVVPQFKGRMLQTLNPLLDEAGVMKGKVSHVHSDRYAAGKIMSHNPVPETVVGRDTRINLLVSQGGQEKKYLMPDLIGRLSSSVIARLKDLDFRVGDVRYAFYPGIQAGIIIKQFPPQGYPVQKRNLITLEVSK